MNRIAELRRAVAATLAARLVDADGKPIYGEIEEHTTGPFKSEDASRLSVKSPAVRVAWLAAGGTMATVDGWGGAGQMMPVRIATTVIVSQTKGGDEVATLVAIEISKIASRNSWGMTGIALPTGIMIQPLYDDELTNKKLSVAFVTWTQGVYLDPPDTGLTGLTWAAGDVFDDAVKVNASISPTTDPLQFDRDDGPWIFGQ